MRTQICKTLTKLFLLLLFLPLAAIAQEGNSTVVFRNVTLIDMRSEQPQPDMTVVISGNRIAKIGKQLEAPANAEIIDASGKYLIPGLWDMHTHSYFETDDVLRAYFPLLIASGVTSVREMHSVHSIKQFNRWREETAKGKIIAPRIAAVGRKVDRTTGISIKVNTADEARRAVRQIKREGYDFVKVYSFLSREAYLAVADEAKIQGIGLAGHVPFTVGAGEASNAGQKSIEHLSEMITSASADEESVRSETLEFVNRVDALRGKPLTPELSEEESRLFDKLDETYREEKVVSLANLFVKNATYHCPTLIIFRHNLSLDEPALDDESRLRYVPLKVRRYFRRDVEAMVRSTPTTQLARDFEHKKRWYAKRREIFRAMHRAGVKFLAGSDAVAPAAHYVVPGFGLHDELQLLVKADLSPFEALQAATYNPAKYSGLLDSLGTIEEGKLADLILLDANPLADISNTRKINSVVANGRLLDRKTLDEMLNNVEAAAKKK